MRFLKQLNDITLIQVGIAASALHVVPVLVENIQVRQFKAISVKKNLILQMLQGNVPWLTKGPLALFLGGEKMLDILDDGKPGLALPYLILFCFVFQLSVIVYRRIRKKQLKSTSTYAQDLRKSLVENVLNIYSLFFIIFCNIITFIYIYR